jgi:hypothetical protein
MFYNYHIIPPVVFNLVLYIDWFRKKERAKAGASSFWGYMLKKRVVGWAVVSDGGSSWTKPEL